MDILWLAVQITFRLIMWLLRATIWMFQNALPLAFHSGEEMSKQVNLRWYPFPFGNLLVEMIGLWLGFTWLMSAFFGASGGVYGVGIAIGILILPIFIGFGLGTRRPEQVIDAPPPMSGSGQLPLSSGSQPITPVQLPTIDMLDDPSLGRTNLPASSSSTGTRPLPPISRQIDDDPLDPKR
jgi:hypothetical protein